MTSSSADLKAHAVQSATAYLVLRYEEREQPAAEIDLDIRALGISDDPLRHEYLDAFLDTLAAGLDGDDPFIIAGKLADQPDEHAEAQVYFRAGQHAGHAATIHSHHPADRETATLSGGCVCGTMSSDDADLARSARHLAPTPL